MPESDKTTILPFITVNNAQKAVDFYVGAFGAVETERSVSGEQRMMARLSIAGAEFWLGDEEPEFGNFSPAANAPNPVRIILQTRSADELFSKAILGGATVICPMTTEEEWRIGKLRDPFGHVWEIGYIIEPTSA